MLKNKKGSLMDILFIAVTLLVLSFSIIIGYIIFDNINNQLQTSTIVNDEAKIAANTLNEQFPGVIDNSFLFLAIALAVGTLILAAMVRVHPIFIAIFFIALIFLIFFCGIFSNIYQEASDNALFSQYAREMVLTSTIMTYLPFIVGIFGIILMVIMYRGYQIEQAGF